MASDEVAAVPSVRPGRIRLITFYSCSVRSFVECSFTGRKKSCDHPPWSFPASESLNLTLGMFDLIIDSDVLHETCCSIGAQGTTGLDDISLAAAGAGAGAEILTTDLCTATARFSTCTLAAQDFGLTVQRYHFNKHDFAKRLPSAVLSPAVEPGTQPLHRPRA